MDSKFVFDGVWESISIQLAEFAILDHPELTRGKGGEGLITFYDPNTLAVDPAPAQMKTVEWLMDAANQRSVLVTLLPYLKNVIYPKWKTFISAEEYPEAYPALNAVRDLRNIVGLSEISVLDYQINGQAIFAIHWSSFLDYEHGVSTVHNRETILTFGEGYEYELPPSAVAAGRYVYDQPEDPSSRYSNNDDYSWYLPHPKYGKLRQWQRWHNGFLPVKMLRNHRYDELDELLEQHPELLEKGSKLLESALSQNGVQEEKLIQYLVANIKLPSPGVVRFALAKERYDVLIGLINNGYGVNQPLGQDSLLSTPLVQYYKTYDDDKARKPFWRQVEWLIENGLNPYLEDSFGRNAFFTLNRYDDKQLTEAIELKVKRLLKGTSEKPWWQKLFG
jgi:hypothetical protein